MQKILTVCATTLALALPLPLPVLAGNNSYYQGCMDSMQKITSATVVCQRVDNAEAQYAAPTCFRDLTNHKFSQDESAYLCSWAIHYGTVQCYLMNMFDAYGHRNNVSDDAVINKCQNS